VNWLTTSASPPVSRSERSKRPSSFSKIRNRATFPARRGGQGLVVAPSDPEQHAQAGPDLAGHVLSHAHARPETRCTTAFMFRAETTI